MSVFASLLIPGILSSPGLAFQERNQQLYEYTEFENNAPTINDNAIFLILISPLTRNRLC